MFLSDLSIKQPVLATMVAVSLMALGVFSYRQLAIDMFPDVEIPVLTVQTLYTGASPETVEREVTKRITENEEASRLRAIDPTSGSVVLFRSIVESPESPAHLAVSNSSIALLSNHWRCK